MRMLEGYKNCGPVALQTATGIAYDTLIKLWPGSWLNPTVDTGRLNVPNDTPWDHFGLLDRLGIKYRTVSLDMLLSGQCALDKTVLLLHLVRKPSSRWERLKNFFIGIYSQHWVTLHSVSPDGANWTFDWGSGTAENPDIKTFDVEGLENLLLAGWPYCVYEVGKGDYKPTWYQKLFANYF